MPSLLAQESLNILHFLYAYLKWLLCFSKSIHKWCEHSPLRYTISRGGYLRSLKRDKFSFSNCRWAYWGACNKASSYKHVSWSLLKALASWLSNLVRIRITGTEKCKSSTTEFIWKIHTTIRINLIKELLLCSCHQTSIVSRNAVPIIDQSLQNESQSNPYQIAWSFLSSLLAFARSDMKAWMVSISFVAPASMPRESWNTNPGLLSKTNSSSILCTPRWEVVSSDRWKYQVTNSCGRVNLKELRNVTRSKT